MIDEEKLEEYEAMALLKLQTSANKEIIDANATILHHVREMRHFKLTEDISGKKF